MWFKYFNKNSWKVRLWRDKNLTYKYNDNGIGSNFYIGKMGS